MKAIIGGKVWVLRLAGAAALAVLGTGTAGAADVVARLRALVADVHTLKANFQQSVQDARKRQLQRSSGTVVLQRPGHFRWDYSKPYPQLIVGDGERIWIYDTELEQITVRPMSDALGSAPSLLLSGGLDLDESFSYRALQPRDGLDWVELVPRKPDSNFAKVDLGFGPHALAAMELVDSFGQVTRFQFTDVKIDAAVDPALFQFTPPPGVDVIGR